MLKILIADDHAVVRTGLKHFLESTGEFDVCAEAHNGQEVLELVRQEACDVLVLDVNLPDLHGLEVLKRVKREQPDLPVVIFSMFSEDELAVSALRVGAAGYLCKEGPPAQLLTALRTVATGARYISPELTEKLLGGAASLGGKWLHEALSPREMEVLLYLSRGLSLTKIGEKLHVSVKTVSTYRGRILEKLELESNADITRYVIEHRLD